MRSAPLLPLLLLASSVHAQVFTDPVDDLVRQAYTNVRTTYSGYAFELTGKESYGKITRPLHAVLYWRVGYDARTGKDSAAQVDLTLYERTADGNERPTLRIVGDGVSLYRYDILRSEVAITTYGFYGLSAPSAYPGSDAPKLLAQLRTATPGPAAYLVRLLSEINPRSATPSDDSIQRYREWLPGRTGSRFDAMPYPTLQNEFGKPVDPYALKSTDHVGDPITGRVFLRGNEKAQTYAFYGVFPGTDRTATFTLEDGRSDEEKRLAPDSPRWRVKLVNVAQRTADRMLDLVLDPAAGAIPAWAFIPLKGADATRYRPVNPGGH